MKGGKYSGTTRSNAKDAYGNNKAGNTGKKIGDSGQRGGNRRTRQVSDRYK